MNKVRTRRQEDQRKKQLRNTFIILISASLLLIAAGVMFAKSAWSGKADPSLVEVSGQPSLKVNQELIDYGDVKVNTNLTFDLELTNVGDQPLEISEPPYIEVKEGC